jgi:hypothetical protein
MSTAKIQNLTGYPTNPGSSGKSPQTTYPSQPASVAEHLTFHIYKAGNQWVLQRNVNSDVLLYFNQDPRTLTNRSLEGVKKSTMRVEYIKNGKPRSGDINYSGPQKLLQEFADHLAKTYSPPTQPRPRPPANMEWAWYRRI